MPIQDVRELFRESSFGVFKKIVADGGTVRAFVVANAASYSRSAVDGIVNQEKAQGRHLLWARRAEDGTVTSSFPKAVGEETVRQLLDATGAGNGQLAFVVAGEPDATSKTLGQLRLTLAKRDGLLDPEKYEFLWVVDFPLLEWDAEEKRYVAMHHPFTSPIDDDLAKLDTDPGSVRAKAYDLVLNGSEIGGGSIRIHDARRAEPDVRAAQHQRRGGEAAVRLLPRGAGVRHAAAWRHRARPRPDVRDSRERELDSRSDRLPEDRGGRGSDDQRAVAGEPEATAGTAFASEDVTPA